jgi:predicted ArsR family transcriptional regulator
MGQSSAVPASLASVPLPFDRDVFLRSLLRELAGSLQQIVGMDDAAGFISLVGQRIGEQVNGSYCQALSLQRLSREQVSEVLVDFKRRIGGDFFVLEESPDRIVLGNRRCPFAEKVLDRPALCMMTSNVFGYIAAENLGYAKVVLEKTIAQGAPGCRVAVYLKPEASEAAGREYYAGAM